MIASLFVCDLVDPVGAMRTTPQERDRRQVRVVDRQLAVAPELELALADGASTDGSIGMVHVRFP